MKRKNVSPEEIEKVKNLYAMIVTQQITDGALGAKIVEELEHLVGHEFKTSADFHYYIADFLKRKQIVHESAGRKLARLRKKSKLTQIQLAAQLGVDRRTLIRWENDDGLPSKEALKWIELQNGVSPDNVTFNEKRG